MPREREVWNRVNLDFAFSTAKRLFGKLASWHCKTVPGDEDTEGGRALNEQYALFCWNLGEMIGTRSPNSVAFYIHRVAMMEGPSKQAIARTFVAALDAGFIETRDLDRPDNRPAPFANDIMPLLRRALRNRDLVTELTSADSASAAPA